MAESKVSESSEAKGKKVNLKRTVIQGILKQIKPALEDSNLDQTAHYIFAGDHIITYSDRISIAAPLNTGLKLSVRASDLFKVISDMPDDDIDMEEEEKDLIVESNSTTAGITKFPVDGEIADLIKSMGLADLKPENWKPVPEGFTAALRLCMFSTSKNDDDIAFNCIRVTKDRVVSTDHIRISRYRFKTAGPDIDVMLPLASVRELVKFGVTEIQQIGPSWIFFRNDGKIIFAIRVIDTKLPDGIESFLDIEGTDLELPTAVMDAMDAILVFAPSTEDDDSDRLAELRFKSGKITCRSESQAGWIERDVNVPGLKKLDMGKLSINPMFFRDVLALSTKMSFTEDRAKFTSDCFEHVMSLPMDDSGDGAKAPAK